MSESDFGALIGGMFGLVWCLFIIAMVVFAVFIYWKIFSKSGHPGALGLLMFIPLVNLGVLIWFAFSEWPIEKEVAELRSRLAMQTQPIAQQQPMVAPPSQPPAPVDPSPTVPGPTSPSLSDPDPVDPNPNDS